MVNRGDAGRRLQRRKFVGACDVPVGTGFLNCLAGYPLVSIVSSAARGVTWPGADVRGDGIGRRGDALEIKKGTVMSRLFHARKAMQKLLTQDQGAEVV